MRGKGASTSQMPAPPPARRILAEDSARGQAGPEGVKAFPLRLGAK